MRFILICTLALASVDAVASIPASERDVLLGLYEATDGDHWIVRKGWGGEPGTECSWYGITCDENGSTVVMVVLEANGLAGNLPSLSSLTHLQWLGLRNNALRGSIPHFSNVELGSIDLAHNQLTGAIPALDGTPGLYTLYLFDNQLTGNIPPLGALPEMHNLDLAGNRLSGPIPDLSNLGLLDFIDVSDNRLTGHVPPGPLHTTLWHESSLCPNMLAATPDANWDASTGVTPWYRDCDTDTVFRDGFES